MPEETRWGNLSNKATEKWENLKKAVSTNAYIADIAKYIKKITDEMNKNTELTEIYKMLNNGEKSLLARLKKLYSGEGETGTVSLGWNLKKTKRTIWNWFSGNYNHTSDADMFRHGELTDKKMDDFKSFRAQVKKGKYTRYKPCMYNMLKLLALDNNHVDWLIRLDVMADKSLVQSDFVVFGSWSRWNANVREKAKNLKDALEKKITRSSLKKPDDYFVLFGGNLKEVYLYDPRKEITEPYEKKVVPENNELAAGNPLLPTIKLEGGGALDLVREIFRGADGLPCYLRKFVTSDNKYGAILNRDGVQEIYSIKKEQFDNYTNETQTFSEIMKPAL